jgi:hypothetical protein
MSVSTPGLSKPVTPLLISPLRTRNGRRQLRNVSNSPIKVHFLIPSHVPSLIAPIDWDSKIFPKLKEMIDAERVRKEEVERMERFRQRNLEFAKIYISTGVSASEPEDGPFMMPSYGIFKENPRVHALLTENDCRIPFTEDRFEEIEDLIVDGAVWYNIRTRRDLARMHGLFLLQGDNEEEADEFIIQPFLSRATTVFHLDSPAAPSCLSYHTITEILHLSLCYWMPEIGDPPPWSITSLAISPDILAGKITRELLRIVGAPDNSTWEQMEDICGERLICTCRKPGFEQPVEVTSLASLFTPVSVGEQSNFISQIKHIRHERTWDSPSESHRWRDEGREDGLYVDFFIHPFIRRTYSSGSVHEGGTASITPSRRSKISLKSFRRG